jgi:hypothetical protein
MVPSSKLKGTRSSLGKIYLWFVLSVPICLRQSLARGLPMTITLNHTIVPACDKRAAAQFFARIFGLHADPKSGHFAPVRVNDTLTLLFDPAH